jgi:hypothetical protein
MPDGIQQTTDSNSAFQFDADPDLASQNDADLDQDPQHLLVYGMVPGIWLSNRTMHSISGLSETYLIHSGCQ